MEITVYQRIKAYIDDNRISLNALAKTLNMNQSTVLRQVKGEQTLSANVVAKVLVAYPDVSAEWLMRGIGTIYGKQSEKVIQRDMGIGGIPDGFFC
jgi:ribosome-binding protein aMBF1 (putative translation factor)